MKLIIPSWSENLIVFDTETTGISPTTARIVSACVALIDDTGQPVQRYDWLIDPGVPIPEAASKVHGITTDMAKNTGVKAAIGITQIIQKITEFLELGFALVVYNAPYDLTLLKHEAQRHDVDFPTTIRPVLDPLVIDKHVDKYRRGKRTLTAVAEHYGVHLADAHDAGADAIAAGQVLQQISTKYQTHLPDEVQNLHDEQVRWSKDQADSFQDYMRRTKDSAFTANGSWPIR